MLHANSPYSGFACPKDGAAASAESARAAARAKARGQASCSTMPRL